MFESKYRKEYGGLGIGRVERDENFTAPLKFYKNEYEIQYLISERRLYFVNHECFSMEGGCLALVDKKRIPKTCIIEGQAHDRVLLEMKEDEFIQIGRLMGIDFTGLFDQYYGVYDVKKSPQIVRIFSRIEEEILHGKPELQELRVKTEVLKLLSLIPSLEHCRVVSNKGKVVDSCLSKQLRAHEVADYIAGHYAEIQSIDELAERFFINKSYLCRIFKEVINYTISEYINLHRIAAGRQLIMEGKYSMAEIAQMLGCSSLTYFDRIFKNEMEVTPREYKRLLEERQKTQKNRKRERKAVEQDVQ